MFSTLRNRFGIPGVISVMALVFAMFGGAYAASNNSSEGGKATASAKAKKGPRGLRGATGPAGPAGPTGPAGAKGDAGASGSNGSVGAAGPAGQSVKSQVEPPGPNCARGGSKFVAANGTSYACNGNPGTPGAKGEPWTPDNVLPSEATETGIWGTGFVGGVSSLTFPISFPVPLGEAPEPVFVGAFEESKPGCPGRGGGPYEEGDEPTIPEAEPGKLCVYGMPGEGFEGVTNVEFLGFKRNAFGEFALTAEAKPSPTGVLVRVTCGGSCGPSGTWAVTAP